MAVINGGPLLDFRGHIDDMTVFERDGKVLIKSAHQDQPRRLSRKQLLVRERQSHNNALWRAIKETGKVFFCKGKNTLYKRFMSINKYSPVPYLKEGQYHSNQALLLPNMVISDGDLSPISYQLGEVDGKPALLTDLTKTSAKEMELLLYVLEQIVTPQPSGDEDFQLKITVEDVTVDDFVKVPSTSPSPYKSTRGTLALVGERFADPMLGFALVRVELDDASHQRVVTNCTYYERYITEEALQAAAKSYKGLTGEGKEGEVKSEE